MVAFATITDMADRSQGEITASSHPFLQRELDAATAAIQAACGWHIAPVESVRFVRVTRHPRMIFLPAYNIESVTEAVLDGATVDPATIKFDPMTGETNIYARSVDVTFTAGYFPVPANLVTLTLELAAAGLGTSLGMVREQAGAVAVTYSRTGAISADDEPRLAPWRLAPIP